MAIPQTIWCRPEPNRMPSTYHYLERPPAITPGRRFIRTSPFQEVIYVNSGDSISVTVYVCDSKGNIDPSGDYAWFNIYDASAGLGGNTFTQLGKGFGFSGNSAEWIVERPYITVLGGYPELAQYSSFEMSGASATTAKKPIFYSKAENQQITMRENYTPQPDNNVLSTVSSVTGHADSMQFFWKNFY
jgi:hypothetical protein